LCCHSSVPWSNKMFWKMITEEKTPLTTTICSVWVWFPSSASEAMVGMMYSILFSVFTSSDCLSLWMGAALFQICCVRGTYMLWLSYIHLPNAYYSKPESQCAGIGCVWKVVLMPVSSLQWFMNLAMAFVVHVVYFTWPSRHVTP